MSAPAKREDWLGKEATGMATRSLEFEFLEDRNVPATFTVSTTADSGPGSLRDAINQSNAAAGSNLIQFAPGVTGTITLTTGELLINNSVSILGPGAGVLSISGNNASRIFDVSGPSSNRITVDIAGLTMTNGNGNATLSGLKDGGGILATGLTSLTVQDSIIENCVGNDGGGISANAIGMDLIVQNSQILNNRCTGTLAAGGGINVSGDDFQFTNSTADGNVSSSSGGGMTIQTNTGEVTGSTISNNNATSGGGGGLEASLTNNVTITNSTIVGNQAKGGFSGGGVLDFATMTIANSTIVRNVENNQGGTGGINAFLGSHLSLVSSIVAENTVPGNPVFFSNDIGGTITSLGNNLIGDSKHASGHTAWTSTDILDKPSTLPPLTNNGGPTMTILPDAASFANGNGANPLGLTTDQRGIGFPRSLNGKIDIGAVTGTNAAVSGSARSGGNTLLSAFSIQLDPLAAGYIRALYFAILGRDADSLGLNAYTQMLEHGESRESIARSIWTSREHRSIQVAGYYQQFLLRNGSAAEIDSYVTAMLGGETEEQVIASFLSSNEYRSRFATPDLFVSQIYQDVLGRTPSAAEIATYTNALGSGVSPQKVALSIVTSPESRNRQLTVLYQQFLQRTPSSAELATYQGRFGDPAFITDVAVEMGASDEMFLLGQQFKL
jgi:hypothetical protein